MAKSQPTSSPAVVQDLTGRQYERLAVIAPAGSRNRSRLWRCRCSCGKEIVTTTRELNSGSTRSCGCLKIDVARKLWTKHGAAPSDASKRTAEYHAWQSMLQRCGNPNNPGWANYGGRSITVCERWQESFENFLADMGNRPSSRHSLDRINNEGNYEPGNVRWATREQQNRNNRRNFVVEFRGVRRCLAEWAEQVGISAGTLFKRIRERGWDVERAFFTPSSRSRKGTTR